MLASLFAFANCQSNIGGWNELPNIPADVID